MKIYTKTGDRGETGLVGGRRVPKDDLRIAAYGDIDELNAILGQCRAINGGRVLDGGVGAGKGRAADRDWSAKLEKMLRRLQHELFDLGADLATPLDSKVPVPRVQKKQVTNLEKWIDAIAEEVAPLKCFILPGGCELAAQLHVARTVCRRAERAIVALGRRREAERAGAGGHEEIGENVVKYVNRLSDLLFMMARLANKIEGVGEEKWGKS